MNNLTTVLESNVGKRPLFMCHLVAGFPSLELSERVGNALVRGGADILEVQIPFSDPMADGPSIATACQDALKNGMSVQQSLELAGRLAHGKAPVVMMSYLNPIFHYGIPQFIRDAARARVCALIVPDAPFDTPEGMALIAAAHEHDMCMIPVVTPGVPLARVRVLMKSGSGFVYCTSRQGTTGAHSTFARDLKAYLKELRFAARIPIGLGFGIRSHEDFDRASEMADIVIAGSVFVNTIRSSPDSVEKSIEDMARDICAGRSIE